MLFNSYIFIFIFMPFVLLGWYGLNRIKAYKLALLFLGIMSLWFYGFFNPKYLLIILGSIVFNYVLSCIFETKMSLFFNKIGLIIGLFFNLGLLFYYKYFDFFIENINIIFKSDFALKNILLPLGISFFTFQQISFVIDRYKGKAKHYGFVQYLAYVSFFPQLVAGPIVLYDELMPQFEDDTKKTFNSEYFFKGLCLFIIGLSKKVLLADVIANVANYGFDNCIFLDSISTFIVGLAYAFELYFDFSGYSDMAIGIGRMFNIDLPVNFDSPYKAYSMKNFWQRWHKTLSRFFLRYVYIPLGGSRKGKARALLNVFIVFMLSGLWHGAAWTFVLWGIMQGLGVMWDNLYVVGVNLPENKQKPRFVIPKLLGQFITFNYYVLSMFFFRANSLSDAFLMLKILFSFKYTGSIVRLFPSMDLPEIYIAKQVVNLINPAMINNLLAIALLIIIILASFVITRKNAIQIVDETPISNYSIVIFGILFVWAVISFSQVSTFIYFNF